MTEIIALLDLLDDENPDVVEAVRGRLEKLGEAALDALMEASQGDDAKRRVRARAAVRSISDSASCAPSASACGAMRRSVASTSSRMLICSRVLGLTMVPSRPKRQAWKRL